MAKLKMIVDKPVCIAQGPTYEEVSWGPWQFPSIREDEEGNIYASVGVSEDNESARGKPSAWFISRDRGVTWEETSPECSSVAMTLLSNGDRLGLHVPPKYQIPDECFEGVEPLDVLHDWCDVYIYNREDIKNHKFDNRFQFNRLRRGETKSEIDYGEIRGYDKQTVSRSVNGVDDPFLFGRLKIAPDGAVWATDYGRERNQKTGKYHPGFAANYFRSADCGKTWTLESVIEPEPLGSENYNYYCEPDITWLPDGTAITLLRGDFCTYAVSRDGGYHWEHPQFFDKIGVYPAVKALKCGAVLASYGRPGFLLRASLDGKCDKWEEPYVIIEPCDHTKDMNEPCDPGPGHGWGTCSYSDILAISDNEALVVYTDFFYPDEKGIKRKSLMVVKVSFAEE